MKQLFLIFALLYGLNIQASDIYVALGQSISDAVRQAREMVRKGEAASVTIRLEPGIHRITDDVGIYLINKRAVFLEKCFHFCSVFRHKYIKGY